MNRGSGTQCIFCEGSELSKEHVFSKWIHGLLGPGDSTQAYPETDSRVAINFDTGVGSRYRNIIRRRGRPITRQIRRPCRACNNGWMSAIDSAVVSVLTPLIQGKPNSLSTEDQARVAAWSFLKTVVAEYGQEDTRCIPDDQRLSFVRDKSVPAGWRVYVARCNPPFKSVAYEHSFQAPEAAREGGPPLPNAVQSTTFVIGGLFVYVVGPCNARVEAFLDSKLPASLRVWPPSLVSVQPMSISPGTVAQVRDLIKIAPPIDAT